MRILTIILVAGIILFVLVAGRVYNRPASSTPTESQDAGSQRSEEASNAPKAEAELAQQQEPSPSAVSLASTSQTTPPTYDFGDAPANPEVTAEQPRGFGGLAPAEAAAMVASRRGQATVVLIYRATCPRSQALLRDINQVGGAGALPAVLAFSVEGGGLPAPFSTYPIRSYAPGELDRAMAGVGIRVGATFLQPLVAILDDQGRVAAEWQGLTSVRPIQEALAGLPQG